MRMQILSCVCLLFVLLSVSVDAQEIPAGGRGVLPDNPIPKMSLQGGSKARRRLVSVSGMPFAQVVQGQTLVPCERIWDAQFSINTAQAVSAGDVLLAEFWAKGVQSSGEAGEVYSEFIFERNGSPWTKSVSYPIVVVDQWKRFFVPFKCVEDYSAGQAAIRFRLGYDPQTIQIGGLQLLNYRKRMDIADLPRTSVTYAGMEADAPWRALAEQMIEQYRKGDVSVTVKDENGQALEGVEVRIQMLRHAYGFGAAVDARTLMRDDRNSDRYNTIIRTHFNRVVMENDLKWVPWEDWDRTTKLSALQRLSDWDIEIRGHCLVWPSWRHLPDDLEAHQHDPDYLHHRVLDHIADEVGTLSGMLVDWDVINENYSNHDLMDILGDQVMVDWFNQAHAMDPQARLYLNDYAIISGGGLDKAHRDHFIGTVQFLLDHGAPIHGLGTQCHFGSNPTPPERIWSILDQLDDFGLEIQCTEFDIDADDGEYQVNYMRDFMTAYFAHPSTVGILMWGFWEGKHWRPRAALWDSNWRLRAHGEVWIELVTQTWWTDTTVVTDASGSASVRGFYGDYTMTLTHNGPGLRADFEHLAEGTRIDVLGTRIQVNDETVVRTPPRGR